MREHAFWLLLVAGCTAWYSTVVIYVAFRGAYDIRNMLRDLHGGRTKPEGRKPPTGVPEDGSQSRPV